MRPEGPLRGRGGHQTPCCPSAFLSPGRPPPGWRAWLLDLKTQLAALSLVVRKPSTALGTARCLGVNKRGLAPSMHRCRGGRIRGAKPHFRAEPLVSQRTWPWTLVLHHPHQEGCCSPPVQLGTRLKGLDGKDSLRLNGLLLNGAPLPPTWVTFPDGTRTVCIQPRERQRFPAGAGFSLPRTRACKLSWHAPRWKGSLREEIIIF